MIWNRKNAVLSALEGWQQRGLIEASLAKTLRDDVSTSGKARSFTWITMLLGVICLAFGVMTFVGANWDKMSSLARVGLLFAALWASWGASVFFKSRKQEWPAQLFVMLACAMFGASIMLIGQIYHIQGSPKDAVWLWAVGTGFAALATRSVPALAFYVVLITLWSVMDFELFGSRKTMEYSYIFYWLVGAAGAWWLSSRYTAQLLSAALVFWLLYVVAFSIDGPGGQQNLLPLQIILACSFVAVCLTLLSLGGPQYLKSFEPPALVYLMILIAGLVFMWYMATDMRWNGSWRMVSAHYLPGFIGLLICAGLAYFAKQSNNTHRYDVLVTGVFAGISIALAGSASRVPFIMEAFMLAMSIWTIRMGWRIEYRQLTSLGFAGFSAVMLLIYFETLGNLLDTSLFYLGVGVLMLLGAYFIPRFARKTKAAAKEGAL